MPEPDNNATPASEPVSSASASIHSDASSPIQDASAAGRSGDEADFDATDPLVQQQLEANEMERNRKMTMLFCVLFFGLVVSQYLWRHFERPVPLDWQRGEAFEAFHVDVNTATWVDWMQLPGIGQTMANRIITDRQINGPFSTIEDITRVKGIGPRTFEDIKRWLTITHDNPDRFPPATDRELETAATGKTTDQ